MEFKNIGYVSSPNKLRTDKHWGEVVSQIIIDKDLEEGLTGLKDFTHVIIIYYLNEAKFMKEKHLLRRPQGREDMPMVGIFSQRAKDRPNPIGITSVEIISVEENIITVKGLDAIDNTPVLDIKPYYPKYDLKEESKVPEWVDILLEEYF